MQTFKEVQAVDFIDSVRTVFSMVDAVFLMF